MLAHILKSLPLLALPLLAAGCASDTASGSTSGPAVVHSTYEAAVAGAVEAGKPLLVNFTGHTCVVCRQMETQLFEEDGPRAARAGFVEARLHVDDGDPVLRAANAEVLKRLAAGAAQPVYIALDPATGRELGRFEGGTNDGDVFRTFLDDAAAAL